MDIEPSGNAGMSELLAALDDSPAAQTQDPETDEPEEQLEATQDEATEEQTQEEEQPQGEEPELVDLDGKKLEIPAGTPKALVETVQKMAADLKADHTRKTQAAAEVQAKVTAAAQALATQHQLMSQTAELWADVRDAQKRVEAFKAVDWDAIASADPGHATKLMAAYQTAQVELQSKGAAWTQSVQQFQAKQAEAHDSELAERWTKATQAAKSALGASFTPQADKAAQKWLLQRAPAKDFAELAARFADPVVLEAVVKAAQWDAANGKPMTKVAAAPKVIKPAAPAPARQNEAALDRLKKTGRASELIEFL